MHGLKILGVMMSQFDGIIYGLKMFRAMMSLFDCFEGAGGTGYICLEKKKYL